MNNREEWVDDWVPPPHPLLRRGGSLGIEGF
jgi:hypothetical protein